MMKTQFILVAVITVTLISIHGCTDEETNYQIRVTGLEQDCSQIPVHCAIRLPERFSSIPEEEIAVNLGNKETGTTGIPGQIIKDDQGRPELWWIIPHLKTNSSSTWQATLSRKKGAVTEKFTWEDKPGKYLDLLFNDRKVSRFIYGYDTTSEQRFFETYKPFHHIFDEKGEYMITEGPNGDEPYNQKAILYPHHRGLFIGWPLTCDGESYSYWGMNKTNKHMCAITQGFSEHTAGPVLARSNALISWNDTDGTPIIVEERKTTVYRSEDQSLVLLDFESQLKSVKGEIRLNGNADHGGVHYRPHNDVAVVNQSWRYFRLIKEEDRETSEDVEKRGGATEAAYIFHADSVAPVLKEPVDERRLMTLAKFPDLPWTAMSYGLKGTEYTVQHMNHPGNPGPTEYSAYRGYGRFGAWFQTAIPKGETLKVKYRIWISTGEIPARDEMARKYVAFKSTPEAEVL